MNSLHNQIIQMEESSAAMDEAAIVEPAAKKSKISSPTENSLDDIELAVLRIKTEKLEKLVGKLKAEKEHFMKECDEQMIQISNMEETLAEYQEEKNEAKAEIDFLKFTVNDYVAKIKVFEAEKQQFQAKIKNLQDEIASMKTIKSEIKDTVEDERENFQATIDQLKAEISELKNNSTKTPSKNKEKAPKLCAEEQAAADDESNALQYPPGARVYAIWGNRYYYPAIVGHQDPSTASNSSSSSCKIFYTDGETIRKVSRNGGIIPICMLKVGSQIYVEEKNEYEEKIVFKGKILAVPSIRDWKQWHRGIYKIEISNREFPVPVLREFKWSDIFFTYTQYKQILKAFKKSSKSVDQGRQICRSPAITSTRSSSFGSSATPEPRQKPITMKGIETKEDSPDSEDCI